MLERDRTRNRRPAKQDFPCKGVCGSVTAVGFVPLRIAPGGDPGWLNSDGTSFPSLLARDVLRTGMAAEGLRMRPREEFSLHLPRACRFFLRRARVVLMHLASRRRKLVLRRPSC